MGRAPIDSNANIDADNHSSSPAGVSSRPNRSRTGTACVVGSVRYRGGSVRDMHPQRLFEDDAEHRARVDLLLTALRPMSDKERAEQMSQAERRLDAEDVLKAWADNNAKRDELIREAVAGGVPIRRIHAITGIARTTVMRVLGDGGGSSAPT